MKSFILYVYPLCMYNNGLRNHRLLHENSSARGWLPTSLESLAKEAFRVIKSIQSIRTVLGCPSKLDVKSLLSKHHTFYLQNTEKTSWELCSPTVNSHSTRGAMSFSAVDVVSADSAMSPHSLHQ